MCAQLGATALPTTGSSEAQPAPLVFPLPLDPLASTPLVSVLMINHNYAGYIGGAIDSVLRQTYGNLELVVCDDASDDDSCRVVENASARDPRVWLIRHTTNTGMAGALNSAFAASRGAIVCVLDSDDLYTPDKLEKVVAHFQRHPDAGLVIHRLMMVDRDNRDIQAIPFLTGFESGWISARVVQRGGRWRNAPGGGLCLRREVAERIFPIPETPFRRAADGFIFTLAPLLTPVAALDDALYRYRIHDRNDYTQGRMDALNVGASLRFIETQTEQANARLRSWGRADRALDLERNVLYRQYQFAQLLLGRTAWSTLARTYLALGGALLRDDLYSAGQKLAGLLVYGVGVTLPARLRRRWLNLTLGPRRWKTIARTGMRAAKPLVRLRSRRLSVRSH